MFQNKFQNVVLIVVFFLSSNLQVNAQKRKVEYQAERMTSDRSIADDAKRLIGNVVFRDNGTTMYCDSAYFYSNSEDFDAFGKIRVIPDDGKTELTGTNLHYTANERVANISGNVKLKNREATLKTNIIYYNLNTGIANYPNEGTIVSDSTIIVSKEGYFNKNTNQFSLIRKVIVNNPNGNMYTDTMGYNTKSKILDYLAPTYIINAKKNTDTVYCERGWYKSDEHLSLFRQRAWVMMGGHKINGDSLLYNENTFIGQAFGNVVMRDSSKDMLLKGDYVLYNKLLKNALVTKNALMVQLNREKSKVDSFFLHADTMYFDRYTEMVDTISKRVDTIKYVKAYHHVKFFKFDLQGKCDSLYYTFKDSSMQFIGKPVLWSNNLQITGEHIQIFIKNKKMDKMYVNKSAFIISQEDSIRFNQIKGRNMIGYFANNKMQRMNVKGNGQFLYFAKDKGVITGINKTESSDVNIYFKDSKLSKITPLSTVEGSFYPPSKISGSDLLLKDFKWYEENRPKVWRDVFVW